MPGPTEISVSVPILLPGPSRRDGSRRSEETSVFLLRNRSWRSLCSGFSSNRQLLSSDRARLSFTSNLYETKSTSTNARQKIVDGSYPAVLLQSHRSGISQSFVSCTRYYLFNEFAVVPQISRLKVKRPVETAGTRLACILYSYLCE